MGHKDNKNLIIAVVNAVWSILMAINALAIFDNADLGNPKDTFKSLTFSILSIVVSDIILLLTLAHNDRKDGSVKAMLGLIIIVFIWVTYLIAVVLLYLFGSLAFNPQTQEFDFQKNLSFLNFIPISLWFWAFSYFLLHLIQLVISVLRCIYYRKETSSDKEDNESGGTK